MRDVLSAAQLSLEVDKGKHVIAAGTALVSTAPTISSISSLLTILGLILGCVATSVVIRKTYVQLENEKLDREIKRIELARVERRER